MVFFRTIQMPLRKATIWSRSYIPSKAMLLKHLSSRTKIYSSWLTPWHQFESKFTAARMARDYVRIYEQLCQATAAQVAA